MQRQRHTLLSLAVCAALGGALPAVYAQTQDRAPDTRSDKSAPDTRSKQPDARPEAQGNNVQGAEHDRFLWDRNEYRDRQDLARNDTLRDHDGLRSHRDFRGDFQDARNHSDIRSDFRDIREDRTELQRDLADRAANRDQLKVALGTNDRDGIAWERGQIRENNREIRQDRADLRSDLRDAHGDLRDVRNDRRDFDGRHDRDPRVGEHRDFDRDHRDVRNVDFRHDQHDRRDFGHDRGKPDFDHQSHDRRDFGHDRGHNGRSMEVTHRTDMKADTKVASK